MCVCVLKKEALDNVIKQSMLSEIDTEINIDDDAKEAIERHQLESIKNEDPKLYEEEQEDKKKQLDEFEAKLDKIKLEHEKAAQEKDSSAENKLKKLLNEKSSKQVSDEKIRKNSMSDDDESSDENN